MAGRFDPERMAALLASHGAGGLIGQRFVASGEDWVELAFDWREDLVGDPASGILASGPIITLLDNVTSLATWTRLGKLRPQATVDLRIDYLRPSPPGAGVIARGECYRLTRSIAFVRGTAHNGDPADPIAHTVGTFMGTEP